MPTTERTIKITLLGGSESGKTSVIQSLLGPTITYINASEISIPQHIIDIDGENITLQYRDFASNPTPEVASVIPTYIPSTQLFIGCFDLTRAEDSLTQLKAALVTQCRLAPNANIIIVGTKADLTANYSRRNVKSLFKAFIADLNQSTLKNLVATDHYLPMSDRDKTHVQDLKKTIVTQIQYLPKRTPTSGDTTMPAQTVAIHEPSKTSKPGYFSRFTNFFNRHPYVRNGLIAFTIIVGVASVATFLGLFAAGLSAAFGVTAAAVAAAAALTSAFGTGVGFTVALSSFLVGGLLLSAIGATAGLFTFAKHKKEAALAKPISTDITLTQGQGNMLDRLNSTPPSADHRSWAQKSTPATAMLEPQQAEQSTDTNKESTKLEQGIAAIEPSKTSIKRPG